ncbi:hypothetical protein ACFQU7_08190 [Pseudoroseomonas wenyumeiae]
MIDGGILASGGRIITRAVPEALRWSDLSAFEECIAALASTRQN